MVSESISQSVSQWDGVAVTGGGYLALMELGSDMCKLDSSLGLLDVLHDLFRFLLLEWVELG